MKRPLHVRMLETFFPFRFFLARLTRFAPLRKIITKLYFEHDDMLYVPKDTVIAMNKNIMPPESLVVPSRLVEHFVEQASHRWIMNFCICREANHCQDYPQGLGCLFLGEASQHIDSRLGHPASKEEALEHLHKCREVGLVHLIGRNKLDAAWLKIQPDDKLMTICNCCPCCCLWLMLPVLDPRLSAKVNKMPGVEVTVSDTCIGCGTCLTTCFVNAITLEKNRAVISSDCRGCGRCAEACPNGAIHVTISDDTIETVKRRIAKNVDVT